MKVVALLAVYNEERFIDPCLQNLIAQGIQVYLIDNESTDTTLAIAHRYLHRGLIGLESFPRGDGYTWKPILQRKAQLASMLEADWFMHVDADEVRLPPRSDITLVDALEIADVQGYNAVNFLEFTFIPTRENPQHDHASFQETMRWYYPFSPQYPHRVNAWRRQEGPVDLHSTGGHRVAFAGLKLYPQWFPMRHYLFLSPEHAVQKYVERQYDPREVQVGWHGWRATLQPRDIVLPRSSELRVYESDDRLDPSHPRTRHYLEERS